MTMTTIDYPYLYHHGVKGMKWGVRKDRSTASGSMRRKKAIKRIVKASQKTQKKRLSQMSDAELKKKIERLELQKKYKSLKKDNQTKGRQMISEIAEKSVKNIGTQALTFALGTAINAALKSKFPDGVVSPKKGQKDK